VTRRLAVLGRDVSRSLSPLLHGSAIAALGLDLEYVAISCPDAEAFRKTVADLTAEGALGVNVTIPYKLDALAIAKRRSAIALEIGAVNRLDLGPEIGGDNTDGPALVKELSALPAGALDRVQVLGAGGAARALGWALRASGAKEVFVCARRLEDATEVAALAKGKAAPLAPISEVTLVISTVPGTEELADRAVSEWIDPEAEPSVYDLAYRDPKTPTPLVARAKARGWPATDGLGMLIEQAALSLAAWTGGDLSQIRAAMSEGLGRRFDSHSGRA
jgi:shikimate dehydrogenase